LLAESPSRFSSRSAPVLLELVGADAGPAMEVAIEIRGQSMRAVRQPAAGDERRDP
jgi:hypothetical protein